MGVLPWVDAGVVVIIFTCIVRLILFPLSKKAIITQVRMKELAPALERIRVEFKNDRQNQALKTMALYKEKNISPFSSFFMLLIQLPIIFALYSIFIQSGLPSVNQELLYSFVNIPKVDMDFLGIVDIGTKSIAMAVIAAIAQFLQLHFSLASTPSTTNKPTGTPSQAEIMQNTMKNMKYIFPIMIFFISYNIASVVALYWTVSSLFTLGQELVVRRHLQKHQPL